MFRTSRPAATVDVLLADYTPPEFLIDKVDLDIDIQKDLARVSSKMQMRRNPAAKNRKAALVLQGETQKLISLKINGAALTSKQYKLTPFELTIPSMPDKATVEIVSTHNPYTNTALSGLYLSGTMLSTQCEAQGFRRIAYYMDRPDVMAKFRVTIHADKQKYPVLLANGNLVSTALENNGRHQAVWDDPFPKPAYLFAMVAGKLDKVSDNFTTKSGRKILLEIYVEPGKTHETGFALAALKKSMKWDEDTYGLEYDLDRFMMVATPFFNMGAMENKGLNIFNDTCVLGRPETATDSTISFIERVVAHEYFHNWTGDRITCRDWFQLSLKEGLTVFREQEFCGDVNSRAVERLGNVRVLRRAQFSEDAGTMAHPIRPDRYQAIDNFYTSTVYQKGSEVVRMIQTMVGKQGFRRGMDLYIKRHDGQAVTCEDFVKCMADANKIDLKQFLVWYNQAGTPVLDVTSSYDAKTKVLKLKVEQSCPPTPGQKVKKPMHIPLAIGMLDDNGKDMIGTQILPVKKPVEEFTFKNIKTKPILSLLRDFSAPVRLNYAQSDDELMFLLAHDSDPFNRWEAAYKLQIKCLLRAAEGKLDPIREERLIKAFGNVLRDNSLDAAFKAMLLSLPSEGELGLALQAKGQLIEIDGLFAARKRMVRDIGRQLREDFIATLKKLSDLDPMATDGVSMGKRSLKNLALAYLAANDEEKFLKMAAAQATNAKNMTDRIMGLAILADTTSPLRDKAFAAFEKRWQKSPTIMDKWLAVQAGARRKDTLKQVKKLMKHPAFDLKNPNRFSALIGAFAGNALCFHAKDGSGYRFIAEMLLKVDQFNPHSGAGMAKTFTRWRDYDAGRQKLMKAELKRLAKVKKLSANAKEIITKSV